MHPISVKGIWRPVLLLLICAGFAPQGPEDRLADFETAGASGSGMFCNPAANFNGYSFLDPEIINKNSAYAPFFVRWDDYYERYYFNRDIQREENIEEWHERFCKFAAPQDVDIVVYQTGIRELGALRSVAAASAKEKAPLPRTLAGNTFAEMIADNNCTEVVDYLIYTRKCEPYVTPYQNSWKLPDVDRESMQLLINEGLARFKQTESHFVKMRYAYQIVRLAHYARQWQQTVDLYNYLMPKVDRKKPSIIFFWTLGHLAGALQKLGKYPEAAYRYALIFRHCPSKRTQAFRSFRIRNDQDWQQTLKLCESDAEKATLYLLRAGSAHSYAVEDMQTIYQLDPANPQLDLLLVGEVQQLEKLFLRTAVTDRKYGIVRAGIRRENAAQHLLKLQTFVRQALHDKQIANPDLWFCLSGYLELLAGDRYAAGKSFDRAQNRLDSGKAYDGYLLRQLETWRTLLEVLRFDPKDRYADEAAFRVRSYDTFKANPNFEPFLQDLLSARYAENKRPGKALLAAYSPAALGYNPNLTVLDDLLRAADEEDPVFLENALKIDTNPDLLRGRLLEIKGMYLFSIGQPEAALATMRNIPQLARPRLTRYSPFREVLHDKIGRPITDTLLLTRLEILEKIADFDFRAKAAAAVNAPEAAHFYYLVGLAYYNMSYFGYEWKAMDVYRSGYNWARLAQGPVFPLPGSPEGNRENLDVSIALGYFERALSVSKDPEQAARAAFMAARCQQKQWFATANCPYRPGSKLIPVLPDDYDTYYALLLRKYSETAFFKQAVKECKWLDAYAR